MHLIWRPPVWLLLAACFLAGQLRPVHGQSEEPRPTITDLNLTGNTVFEDPVLLFHIRTRENRTFLGIPGFTLWRWLYKRGEKTNIKGLSRALRSSGEPPAYLDPQILEADAERLELFYRQEGFRQADVTTRVDTIRNGRHLRVTFEIDQGPPTYIRTLWYEGLQDLEEAQRERLVGESFLVPDRRPADSLVFHSLGRRFSQSLFQEERRHLINVLRDGGYAEVTRDSIRAFVTPVSPDSFDVAFSIRPGRRMRFGNLYFSIEGPERREPRLDTLSQWLHITGRDTVRGELVARFENERRLDTDVLERSLRIRPGALFNQTGLLATKRRLEATGLFTLTEFVPLWSAEKNRPGTEPYLPYRVMLRTRPRHQLRGEFFMLSRDAVLGDESGSEEIGIGLGGSYRNANLLGSGESFRIRAAGSIASALSGRSLLNTAQTEVETSLEFPFLVAPFGRLDRALGLYDGRTRIAMRLLAARREELRLIIRARASLQAGLEMRHSETLTSIVNLVDFDLSDPDTLSGFQDRFLSFIEDPVERERILEDYSRPQVNNALRYTLRSSTTNLFRRDQGYFKEVSFELGGNLPYLLDRYAYTPGIVEGSIPGVPLFRRSDAESSRLIYRQYIRLLVDLRRYRPVTDRTTVAWKTIGGWSHPIGKAPVVPFDRRFYSGGASSVRGWGLRELGPGRLAGSNFETLIQGGDIKFEASLESRTTFLRNVMAANWMTALFMDVGNVWYGPRNPGNEDGQIVLSRFPSDLGVGGGVGIRIAWEYLIVRLDLAYRLHEPNKRILVNGLDAPRLHFGIGQAF